MGLEGGGGGGGGGGKCQKSQSKRGGWGVGKCQHSQRTFVFSFFAGIFIVPLICYLWHYVVVGTQRPHGQRPSKCN